MLRSIGVILISIAFSISPLDGRHLDVEKMMDGKPEDHSGYVRFHEVEDLEERWSDFKKEHGKTYKDSTEEVVRKKIFEENLKEIALHNERYAEGEETYEQRINQFGDLTSSEFVKFISCYKTGNRTMGREQDKNTELPKELTDGRYLPKAADWRPTGAVTRVKNQGQCGSCWAFGAVGSLEGQMYLRSRSPAMVPLSEQNLVDCSNWNGGCRGGDAWYAYVNIRQQGGIDTEDSYQYEAQDGTCRYNPRTSGARVLGITYLPPGREDILQRAVAFLGPTVVTIDASDFRFYWSGIYSSKRCGNTYWDLNHQVVAVGYKSAGPRRDYWIVKNSWGTRWGMDGYILMSRNKDNQCGIALDAFLPIV